MKPLHNRDNQTQSPPPDGPPWRRYAFTPADGPDALRRLRLIVEATDDDAAVLVALAALSATFGRDAAALVALHDPLTLTLLLPSPHRRHRVTWRGTALADDDPAAPGWSFHTPE